MRKLYLLGLAIATAINSFAANLWTGSCTFSDYTPLVPEDRPVISASAFANAKVGDDLVVTLSYYAADPQSWHQCELYDTDITNALEKGVHITDGMTEAVFGVTAELLAKLQAGGCALAGTGYTATSIDLRGFDGTIWEGESTVANWTANPAVNIPGSKFSAVNAGQELVFDVKIINPDKYAQIEVDNASYQKGSFGNTEITADMTEVKFLLTNALTTELKEKGINITGENFVLTKIWVRGGDTPEPPAEGNVVWSGSMTTSDWSNSAEVDADKFTDVKAGSELKFTVIGAGADAQLCLKQRLATGWEEMPCDTDWANYISLAEGDSEVTFAVNEAAAATLKANGLVIAGKNFTLTKIVLLTETSGIESVAITAPAKVSGVYNLNGIRVAESIDAVATPGLYIVGGRKVIIR